MDDLDYLRWVAPFYLDFSNRGFTLPKNVYSVCSPQQRTWEQWRDLLRYELQHITPEIVGDLIMDDDWRPQICGAYFCGFKRWEEFIVPLGHRLVDKKNGASTQGYAFALARMPSHASANYLCGYLSRVGRPDDTTNWYGVDLEWVIAALEWVDEKMGTHRLEPYIEKLVPIRQQRRFKDLSEEYRRLPSLAYRLNLEEQRLINIENHLLKTDEELETYFLPDDGKRQSEWFWNLMSFCEHHFD